MAELFHIVDEPLKRFLVFSYDTYYPGGGMQDMVGSFDDIHEALDCFKIEIKIRTAEIFDRVAGLEIDVLEYGLSY